MAAIVALGALALAACQETGSGAARVTAPGVPIAVESLEGAPEGLQARVSSEVAGQAALRRIDLVADTGEPRYRLKGYLTAYSTEGGDTALTFVWDVFDQARKRTQRVSATTLAKGQADDPWSRIGDTQITKAASDSMNGIATFLAGGGADASTGSQSAASSARPLGLQAE
jgi:hypothetical protein